MARDARDAPALILNNASFTMEENLTSEATRSAQIEVNDSSLTPVDCALLNEIEQFEWDTFLTSIVEVPWSPNTDHSPSSSKSHSDTAQDLKQEIQTPIENTFIPNFHNNKIYSTFPTFAAFHQINQPMTSQNIPIQSNTSNNATTFQPIFQPYTPRLTKDRLYPSQLSNTPTTSTTQEPEKKVHLTDEEKRKNHIASGNPNNFII